MSSAADKDTFSIANPHALATILEASETKSIIASQDIFDISGIKLWARDMPVSSVLQRKLLDRQLRNPLESCLMVEDGVTVQSLAQATQALVESDTPLAALLRPHAARIVHEIAYLPLHSVAQLLLTAGQTSRPGSFDHALQAMALSGALMIEHGGATAELRLAMLGGLLHDLGEMYIDPRYGEADADRSLDFQSYQQLVVHPHVGQLLIAQLTDYPGTLAHAIAEHHEHMDGSGYPHGLRKDAISPLGRLLAVTEGALAALRGERPNLARVGIALRVVPSEYDLSWVGHIQKAVRGQPAQQARLDLAAVHARIARLDAALQEAQDGADALAINAETPALKNAFALAQYLLGRLRMGWYASGLWSTESLSLFFRLRAIERAARLRAGQLAAFDAEKLNLFCDALSAVGR
jgi:hypothetical protein